MTKIIDESKRVELVARKAELEKKFENISEALQDQYETDGWLKKPEKKERYTLDSFEHGRLSRELKHVNDELDRIDALRPKGKNEAGSEERDAFSRYLLEGVRGLNEDEQDKFLTRGPQGDNFKLTSEASRSDDSSGEKLTDITTEHRVIDALDYFGGVSQHLSLIHI